MGMDSSRLFTPPQNHVPESDPAIIRVPMVQMPWSARQSTLGMAWNQRGQSNDVDATGNTKNIPNGR